MNPKVFEASMALAQECVELGRAVKSSSSGKRQKRNRKRSKRRAIFCPAHGCYLDSVSQKHLIYADQPQQLQARGIGRKTALLLVQQRTTVALEGEWLEAFWCQFCQETRWYHVKKQAGTYLLSVPAAELWQQAAGVIHPDGNPSVGEFTRRHACRVGYPTVKDFNFVG